MIPAVMALACLLHAAEYKPTDFEMVEAWKLFWDHMFASDIEEARETAWMGNREYKLIGGKSWTTDFLYYCIARIKLMSDQQE